MLYIVLTEDSFKRRLYQQMHNFKHSHNKHHYYFLSKYFFNELRMIIVRVNGLFQLEIFFISLIDQKTHFDLAQSYHIKKRATAIMNRKRELTSICRQSIKKS